MKQQSTVETNFNKVREQKEISRNLKLRNLNIEKEKIQKKILALHSHLKKIEEAEQLILKQEVLQPPTLEKRVQQSQSLQSEIKLSRSFT